MITVSNGKLTIPEHKRFIGFEGDNLVQTISFLFTGQQIADKIYRLYLTFDDGSVNYFTLPAEVTAEGVVLNWHVNRCHLFKSGVVKAQLKVFRGDGVVYHTTTDCFIVGDSAEFADNIKNNNTEFLECEEKLNALVDVITESVALMPYVGDNGNWYIYDSSKGEYIDSGKTSVHKAGNNDIASGSVTAEKIADGAVNRAEIFSENMRKTFLSLPLVSVNVTESVEPDYYNRFTTPGIYQIDSYMGLHQVLVVLAPVSDAFLMQILLSYDKVLYRGIYCSEDGVYADEDWEEWTDLTSKGMESAENFFCLNSLGKDANPEFIMYQSHDATMPKMLRLPLSVLKTIFTTLEDRGEYFVSETFEGALQEIGSELKGVSDLLSQI